MKPTLLRLATSPHPLNPPLAPSAVRPGTTWHGPATLAVAATLMACGGQADGGIDELEVGTADLALVQRVDRMDKDDGDERAFQRADQSHGLVYGRFASSAAEGQRGGACSDDPRVLLGLVSLETCIGAELFFREGFGGNGRTCGSCHPASHNFTVDVELIAGLAEDDPLFVAEHDPALSSLERPELMRDFGLILVNPDGTEDPTQKFTMRSVSHIFSLATSITPAPVIDELGNTLDFTPTPPLHRTGWSGDGAPGNGELRDFARGAIEQHATRSLDREVYADFLPALDTQLDQLEAYQLSVGRKNELDLARVALTDPGAERGRASYLTGPARRCNTCHNNAGANNVVTDTETGDTFLGNFTFTTGNERARLGRLNELGIPIDGGFGTTPFDSNADGRADVFGRGAFNSQPLIEAADTGPFFHTNAFEEIEDVIRFYAGDVFGTSPSGRNGPPGIPGGPMPLGEADIQELGRFLRVLNAAFNCQLALPRLQAAFQITEVYGNAFVSIQRGLLELARLEMQDALDVLSAVPDLNLETQTSLRHAARELRRASRTLYRRERASRTRAALLGVAEANAALGTGMSFTIGDGTLMF